MIKKNAHNMILSAFVVMILALSTKYLGENLCISVIGDEFGYWSAAAFIVDKPWHSLAATNNYYGWGYGLILTPILYILSQKPVVMYQAAILVNSIMLCFVLMISYKCVLCLSAEKNKIQAALIAGVVTLYPSNLFFVYNTMPEVLLQLLYWLMTWAVLIIAETEFIPDDGKKNRMIFLIVFLSVYAFCVHQRAVGLIIDTAIFFVFFCYRKKEKRLIGILSYFCVAVFFCIAATGIKQLYMEWLYPPVSNNDNAVLDNDFSGIISNIAFSWKAFKGIALSAIGKLYYSFTASALFAGAGVFLSVIKIVQRKDSRILIHIFIILGWLQAVGIAAIGMPGGFETRTDIFIYGRYIEYTLGPLMAVGLVGICEQCMSYAQVSIVVIVQSVIAIITSGYIAPDSINTNMGNIFTLARMFQVSSNHDAVFACSLIAVLIFIIFCNKKISKEIKFMLICCWEIFIFVWTYQQDILPWQKSVNDNVHAVQIYNEKRGMQENLYALDGGIGGKMIQFLNPDEECLLVECIDDVDGDSFVITQYSKEALEDISKQYEVLYRNNIIILWRK